MAGTFCQNGWKQYSEGKPEGRIRRGHKYHVDNICHWWYSLEEANVLGEKAQFLVSKDMFILYNFQIKIKLSIKF